MLQPETQPVTPLGFEETDGGLTFHINGDKVTVPDGLLGNDVFMRHFAEDFLQKPDSEAFKAAFACCDTIVAIPISPTDTHWIRLNADGTREEWTTKRKPGYLW